MDLNQGRFQVNGKSGYVLKPAFMRDAGTEFDPITLTRGAWLQPKTFHIMVEYRGRTFRINPSFRCAGAVFPMRRPPVVRLYRPSSSQK